MSLDKKLKDIQVEIGCCSYHMESKEFRDRIKQAFIDEGWVNDIFRKHLNDAFLDGIKQEAGLMTGGEWFDRFEKELEMFNYEHRGGLDIYYSEYLEGVAKKASGIK